MCNTNKTLALLLTLIITMSCLTLLTVHPANAQTNSKPSVPEFTVKYEKHYSDKPAVYNTNPYNGQQEIISPASRSEWETITIIIKNQPFTPYQTKEGHTTRDIYLYYSVKHKGHFEEEWSRFTPDYYSNQSDGENTEIIFYLGVTGPEGCIMPPGENLLQQPVPQAGDKIDFQVEALIGWVEPGGLVTTTMGMNVYYPGTFSGVESGWSNTQTFILPDTSTVTALPYDSNATPTPSVPELSWFVIVPLLYMLSVPLIVWQRKTVNKNR